MFNNFNFVNQLFIIFINGLVLVVTIPLRGYFKALVAYKLGDLTPKNYGQLTINPMAHMTFLGSIMIVLVGFGWGKPLNVNKNNFRNPKRDNVIYAFSGILVNLIIALFGMIILKLLQQFNNDLLSIFRLILSSLVMINISLAVFNLIPIPNLDGYELLKPYLSYQTRNKMEFYQNYIFLGLLLGLATGILRLPLSFVVNIIYSLLDKITSFVDIFSNMMF